MVGRIIVLPKFDTVSLFAPPPDSGNMSHKQLWGFKSKSAGAVCFPSAVPLSFLVSCTFLSILTLATFVAGQCKLIKGI